MIKDIAVTALTAVIVSAIYCKISAAYTFKVIDGYVKEMITSLDKGTQDAVKKCGMENA